jgi:hypothetical protein
MGCMWKNTGFIALMMGRNCKNKAVWKKGDFKVCVKHHHWIIMENPLKSIDYKKIKVK